jgi:hypothetical protein
LACIRFIKYAHRTLISRKKMDPDMTVYGMLLDISVSPETKTSI